MPTHDVWIDPNPPNATIKDLKYLAWAHAGAKIFSTCGKRQYMAIIVDAHGYVVGVGYNGTPVKFLHCKQGGCPRLTEGSEPGSSYDNCLSAHAEQNAIMNAFTRDSMRGGVMYVNGEPCFTCAKMIANTGIYRLVYTSDPDYVYSGWDRVDKFLRQAGINPVFVPLEELDV